MPIATQWCRPLGQGILGGEEARWLPGNICNDDPEVLKMAAVMKAYQDLYELKWLFTDKSG